MRFFQWLLGGLTIVGLLYAIAINPQLTQIYWLPADQQDPLEYPLYMVIILTFVAGYLIGLFYYWLGSISARFKSANEIKSLKKQVASLEAELTKEDDEYE